VRAERLLFPEIHDTAWEEYEVPETPAAHDVIARRIGSSTAPSPWRCRHETVAGPTLVL
jgi:hypothetical protein